MRPLVVRAHLAFGIAQAAPWGIALDGLLAAELWSRSKAEHRRRGADYVPAMEQADPPDLDLPLARCAPADGPWHWAATCALPDRDPGRTDVRTWTGRVDPRALEQVAARVPAAVSERQGRWRARRMPLLATPCSAVTWHAVGDPAAVADLLEALGGIGKKRAAGEGQVLRWEVEPADGLDPFAAAHLHPDGSLGRPCPPACRARAAAGAADGGEGLAGIRPPYMHPARQHRLVLPALLGA